MPPIISALSLRALAAAVRGEHEVHTFARARARAETITAGITIACEGERATVIITELAANAGASITSAIEFLANEVHHQRLAHLPHANVSFFEHFGPMSYPQALLDDHGFSLVTFQVGLGRFGRPTWTPLEPVTLAA